MKTDKLLLIKNWEAIEQARKLDVPIPQEEIIKSKLLFWKNDVKVASVGIEGSIIMELNNGDFYAIEYTDKLWNELQDYFEENEED